MTDNRKHEKLEAASGESRSELPAKPDVAQARLSLGQTIAKIHEGNLNKHSGSAGSADGSTIEIDMGDGDSVSRLNPRRESDLLAARPEGRRSERLESQPKPAAPEGCLIGMNDYFEKYSSPLVDAYNLSKRLPIGAEVKSLTLESVVDRMKSLPWYKDLKVQIDTHGGNSRYDNEHNTLHIRRRSNKSLEVQEASHESYHASHQLLSQLYDHGKITQADFVNSFMRDEAQSFITEIIIR